MALLRRTTLNLVISSVLAALAVVTIVGVYSGEPADGVIGAALTGDCKEPCDDTGIHSIIECDHVEPDCRDDRCTINNIRFLECTPPKPGGCTVDCAWRKDYNDWNRWVVVRKMPCTHNGAYTYTYPACVGSPYAAETTPCVVNQCSGELYLDQAEEMGRARCGS